MATPLLHGAELDFHFHRWKVQPVMASTNGQYDNPPFGTQSQSTGLGGTPGGEKPNSQYVDGVSELGIEPQASSPQLPGDVHAGGQSYADSGTTPYTDPFAILGS